MSFEHKGLIIDKIGVVGSGQIGPDIALHFTKVFHRYRVPVVVMDIDPAAIERGRAKMKRKIAKGVDTGAFTPETAQAMLDGVTFTTDDAALEGASLVVEAATEDPRVKGQIFSRLEEIAAPDAVLASNSSHLTPEEIFQSLRRKERALVIHYFFPAERNLLVEIVPGRDTDPGLTEKVLALYEAIGKAPIRVGSRYGYAIDPIFEGLFLAAALLVEAGAGTTKEVDAAACRALGLRVGPFTAANLTGGNPITNHGLERMNRELGPWFRSPDILKKALADGTDWEVPQRGETVELPPEREQRIADAMRGAYFGLVGSIIDSGIVSVSDLEMAIELGLDMTPPFTAMNRIGPEKALELVRAYAKEHPGFPVPRCLEEQARSRQPWSIDYVFRRDVDGVAVVTIRRPKVLNALNEAVYAQLERTFSEIGRDPQVKAAVLTGFGVKAFVSGADVHFLARIETPEQAFEAAERTKRPGRVIETLGKPVVCALNGFALGGGNELAMCCTARVIRKGLKMAIGQPEVNLGIIPGTGATQRLPRLIGIEHAAELLRTGRPISGREAVDLGLVLEEVDGDVVERAIELARDAAEGRVELPRIDPAPMQVPEKLPDVDLGHLSRAIDAIMCRAILEGCAKPLEEGLRFESAMFAECTRTRDMRIGLENFLRNGPRSKAAFVHE
ncbi:MAG: 3-hydroxyacyl-CoA dehydrogenase/enoyl-CoA hydratase family protein [Acidobacteria bacterium]|nr:MAG: 3-hydroxyacyl-CoA dehydrogenase/enoyl-CoA hydratase family protein [Acidobacteriota bacterium]